MLDLSDQNSEIEFSTKFRTNKKSTLIFPFLLWLLLLVIVDLYCRFNASIITHFLWWTGYARINLGFNCIWIKKQKCWKRRWRRRRWRRRWWWRQHDNKIKYTSTNGEKKNWKRESANLTQYENTTCIWIGKRMKKREIYIYIRWHWEENNLKMKIYEYSCLYIKIGYELCKNRTISKVESNWIKRNQIKE